MGTIFISYSHKDKDYVHMLEGALQQEGFEPWIDDRIDSGTEWPRVIQDHLDACDAFIVVMTKNAYESKWVQNELARAGRKGKPIFPLLLQGELWLSVEATQYVDVSSGALPSGRFYARLEKCTPRRRGKPVPQAKAPREEAGSYYDRGVKLLEARDYPAALENFNKAISLDPDNAKAYNLRAMARHWMKDYPAALADHTKAIEIDPNNSYAHTERGSVYCELKDYPAALADYTKAIALEPNNIYAYTNRGILQYQMKNYPAALADYRKALELDPKDASLVYNVVLVYAARKDNGNTLTWLRQAIAMDRKYAEWARKDPVFDWIRTSLSFRTLIGFPFPR